MGNLRHTAPGEGEFDTGFGIQGMTLLSKPDIKDEGIVARSLAVDSAGRSYIAGQVNKAPGRAEYYCVKLDPIGKLDSSFGTGGYVTGHFVDGGDSEIRISIAQQVTVLNDNDLLLTGFYVEEDRRSIAMACLHPDGSLNQGFADGGKLLLPVKSRGDFSATVALADGKILLCTPIDDSGDEKTAVIRFNRNGTQDTNFNRTGSVTIAHPGFARTTATDILVDQDGMYVVAGHVDNDPTNLRAFFAKLDTTGALVQSFGDNGYLVVTPEGTLRDFVISRLTQQTNRRLLGVGRTLSFQRGGLMISREANGSKNIQFNVGDPLVSNLFGRTEWQNAYIQRDGKILVYGVGDYSNVVARFIDSGELDLTLGKGTGSLKYAINSGRYATSAVFLNDKVQFLGTIDVGGEEQPCVARGLIA